MINIKEKSKCSGCHGCYNICPRNCIEMRYDNEGFWYPRVDINKCIKCNLCVKVCPIIKKEEKRPITNQSKEEKKVYAAVNKNEIIRSNSSSGGVFTAIAEYVIDNNGVVVGAAFDKGFEVKHIVVESKDELYRLRGSKYVQSKIGDIYIQVKKILNEGRSVLFTGTPCQIDGLNAYLNRTYSNLLVVDIICHGVPSPILWKNYLEYIQLKNNSEISKVNFRSKKEGWRLFSLMCIFKNKKKKFKNIEEDFYLIAFQNNINLRPSCYECKSKGEIRSSDLTLGDFWGIESTNLKLDDDKGTSIIIVNTDKGNKILQEIINDLKFEITNIKIATKANKNYYISASKNEYRKNFISEINNKNFDKIVRKYCKYSYKVQIKNKIKKYIKITLKTFKVWKLIEKYKKNNMNF